MEVQIVVLAAGKSSRFAGTLSKLLQKVGSTEMINLVVGEIIKLSWPCSIVIGHQKELISECIEKKFPSYCTYATQAAPLGTGDAFYSAKKYFKAKTILVTNGDSPLISKELLTDFYRFVKDANLDAACVSAIATNPFGYGRLQPFLEGFVIKEEKALCDEEKEISLINGGVYAFSKEFLDQEFDNFMKQPTTSGEINITDLFNQATLKHYKTSHFETPFDKIRGVNSVEQLQEVLNLVNS